MIWASRTTSATGVSATITSTGAPFRWYARPDGLVGLRPAEVVPHRHGRRPCVRVHTGGARAVVKCTSRCRPNPHPVAPVGRPASIQECDLDRHISCGASTITDSPPDRESRSVTEPATQPDTHMALTRDAPRSVGSQRRSTLGKRVTLWLPRRWFARRLYRRSS